MVERVSALAAVLHPERTGDRVRLSEVRDLTLRQVAAWPEHAAAVRAALGGGAPGRWIEAGGFRILRVEPLKWWLLAQGSPAVPALPAGAAVELDLSHSRCWLRVEGLAARELLLRFLAVDLRDGSFPDGAALTARFGHVSATLLRADAAGEPGYDLLLPRSTAESCWLELLEAAHPLGLEVRAGAA